MGSNRESVSTMAEDEEKMRNEIQALLRNVDLASTSIGKLRASLETAMGLKPGALDAKKDHVNSILQKELVKKIQEDNMKQVEKRKAKPDAEGEPGKKKEKKDVGEEKEKKEKKEKKDKKDKKEVKEEKKEVKK